MTADLSHVWVKFDRATAHFGEFESLFAAWIASNGPAVRNTIEEDRWHVYRWVIREEPDPNQFALVVSDLFHNLRAALDHMVFQLVLSNGEEPKPKQNSFPVVRDEKDWAGAAGGQLHGLTDAQKSEVRALQPFALAADPDDIDRDLLVLLDRLNNVYKHRLLPVTVLSVSEINLRFDFPEDAGEEAENEFTFSERPVVDGAEFYRFRFTPDIPYRVLLVEPPELRIWFEDSELEHRWELADMIERVRQVIDAVDGL